jgi:hypothetical protein
VIRALALLGASLLKPGWKSFDKHSIFKPGPGRSTVSGGPFIHGEPTSPPRREVGYPARHPRPEHSYYLVGIATKNPLDSMIINHGVEGSSPSALTN